MALALQLLSPTSNSFFCQSTSVRQNEPSPRVFRAALSRCAASFGNHPRRNFGVLLRKFNCRNRIICSFAQVLSGETAMKILTRLIAVGTAALMAMIFAPKVHAGVIISETSQAIGPGHNVSKNRVIYIQGSKRKVESAGRDVIVDLDKNVYYVVDNHKREYIQIPLQSLKGSTDASDEALLLRKTRQKRTVADVPCTEYRGGAGNQLERIAVNACVSKNAPGAAEAEAFDRKAAARLTASPEEQRDGKSLGLILSKEAIVTLCVPDLSGKRSYRTAAIIARTQVRQIQVQHLAPQTFAPPSDYTRLSPLKSSPQPPSHPSAEPRLGNPSETI
jgi:hypothetical protein